MAVTMQTSPRFASGVPQTLFSSRSLLPARGYDVTPDGNRFLVGRLEGGGREVPPATVIVNWQAGLKTAGGR